MGEEIFVAEDAVERRSADLQLTGSAQLVAAVEIEHVLHVAADYGVQGQVGGESGSLRIEAGLIGAPVLIDEFRSACP